MNINTLGSVQTQMEALAAKVYAKAQAKAQAKAYKEAQDAALKAHYAAELAAAAEKGRTDFDFAEWRLANTTQAQAAPKSNMLPLAAAAVAVLYFWKG